MLGEAFLTVLNYRDDTKAVEIKTKINGKEADGVDKGCRGANISTKTEQKDLAAAGCQREAPVPCQSPSGLLIPGRPPNLTLDPVVVDCSLLELYPDLQVADSGPIPVAKCTSQPLISPPINVPVQPNPSPDPNPDQGYLVMGGSVNISVDIPELRTNSVLNGMLEKKLEEVYLQHLTENLARCNSNIGNSLLHGLVQPLEPNTQEEVSVEEASTSSEKTISYLRTSNTGHCSTNFSSPVLRISQQD
ncbi:hypothetical protein NL108_013333 [Boleophthalmus pectinirostris]|uniref:uncharacterized protein si:dkey-237j10.2 n=1 Tax=Boleophthalmus pectinirostris TaxID=150288 RepID=UPI000A1C70B8|nr:uncharacterized protein si:dkey-237j10.2 [Boleophthalmus pectinirostris]KAJ0050164.1 hypothetical protein NL108_013333 [Boleophthalmus pectinirostris]